MHGFTRVTLKDHPEIKALVLAADRTYRKHEAVIKVETHVTLSGTYWDGGTRSTYTAVDLATHRSQGAPHYNPPQFGGPTASPEVALPIGTVIVETGIFCGKKATAYISVHPENMAKLLPVPTMN